MFSSLHQEVPMSSLLAGICSGYNIVVGFILSTIITWV
jgi:hypothetical protein